jgi:hypothetical protein
MVGWKLLGGALADHDCALVWIRPVSLLGSWTGPEGPEQATRR